MATVHAVGVDLAWGQNPTGIAHLVGPAPDAGEGGWRLLESRTVASVQAVEAWFGARLRPADAVWAAVDAPLFARNPPGTQRAADLELSGTFRRHRVSCFPVDARHAEQGSMLREALAETGFTYAPPRPDSAIRRGLFETFPTAAQLSLFDLDRPIRYKHGGVDQRRAGLQSVQVRLAMFEDRALPLEDTAALRELLRTDPRTLQGARLKALEDRLDGLLCALVAALAWRAPARLVTYGDVEDGFITVPYPPRAD